MPRYKLTIAYDGTDFVGWQKQEPPIPAPGQTLPTISPKLILQDAEPTEPGRLVLRSVQAVVEQTVRAVVREPITLTGASRTDSGVHAGGRFPDDQVLGELAGTPGGQVAAFTTIGNATDGRGWPAERGLEPLVRAVNSRLPHDILILAAELVEDSFDPIADCTSKGYSYTIHCGPVRPLWNRRTVFWCRHDLDVEAMQEAARHLVGEHDFASFAAIGHGRTSTVRTILSLSVREMPRGSDQGRLIRLDISGTGFLYNMVRIVGGTLVDVGMGRRGPGDMPGIIAAVDRTAAGPTLPPEGLRLEWIRYDRSR